MQLSPFLQHVRSGDEGAVRAGLDAQPELARSAWDRGRDGDTWERGVTALHVAVRHGHPGLVDLLSWLHAEVAPRLLAWVATDRAAPAG